MPTTGFTTAPARPRAMPAAKPATPPSRAPWIGRETMPVTPCHTPPARCRPACPRPATMCSGRSPPSMALARRASSPRARPATAATPRPMKRDRPPAACVSPAAVSVTTPAAVTVAPAAASSGLSRDATADFHREPRRRSTRLPGTRLPSAERMFLLVSAAAARSAASCSTLPDQPSRITLGTLSAVRSREMPDRITKARSGCTSLSAGARPRSPAAAAVAADEEATPCL
mmetsp:Transcript_4519/g.19223  ORF Transcript_4519/g.19223 Transcript_4519/m.19223 type:complete len:230 (-) Transcript_4519:39-728(-)